MRQKKTELQYCFATCNQREYMIWQMASVFHIRRRDDPIIRCGSLVGAAADAEHAVELILSDSHGSRVELGNWQVVEGLAAIPQLPAAKRSSRLTESIRTSRRLGEGFPASKPRRTASVRQSPSSGLISRRCWTAWATGPSISGIRRC